MNRSTKTRRLRVNDRQPFKGRTGRTSDLTNQKVWNISEVTRVAGHEGRSGKQSRSGNDTISNVDTMDPPNQSGSSCNPGVHGNHGHGP